MMAVIIYKFSSEKVGIVHKYHNHGLHSLTPSNKSFVRAYSTGPLRGAQSPLEFIAGKEQPVSTLTIPFVETRQVTASRLVLAKMLSYLSSINSPLFDFISNHPRAQYLTSTEPFPILSVFSKGASLAAFFSTAVLSVMSPQVLPLSSVYVIGHPLSEELYIGSRVAGSNRATGHRSELRKNLRLAQPKLSLLQSFIVSLGGFNSAL